MFDIPRTVDLRSVIIDVAGRYRNKMRKANDSAFHFRKPGNLETFAVDILRKMNLTDAEMKEALEGIRAEIEKGGL